MCWRDSKLNVVPSCISLPRSAWIKERRLTRPSHEESKINAQSGSLP